MMNKTIKMMLISTCLRIIESSVHYISNAMELSFTILTQVLTGEYKDK